MYIYKHLYIYNIYIYLKIHLKKLKSHIYIVLHGIWSVYIVLVYIFRLFSFIHVLIKNSGDFLHFCSCLLKHVFFLFFLNDPRLWKNKTNWIYNFITCFIWHFCFKKTKSKILKFDQSWSISQKWCTVFFKTKSKNRFIYLYLIVIMYLNWVFTCITV